MDFSASPSSYRLDKERIAVCVWSRECVVDGCGWGVGAAEPLGPAEAASSPMSWRAWPSRLAHFPRRRTAQQLPPSQPPSMSHPSHSSILHTPSASDVVASLDAENQALHAKLISKDPQIIKAMKKYIAEGKTFYSFEYFPPKVRYHTVHTAASRVLFVRVCCGLAEFLSASRPPPPRRPSPSAGCRLVRQREKECSRIYSFCFSVCFSFFLSAAARRLARV